VPFWVVPSLKLLSEKNAGSSASVTADLGPVGMRPMDIRRGVRIRRATTRPRSTGSHLLDWGLGVTGRWLISDKVTSPFFLWGSSAGSFG
jgi:hypothetical protein